MDFFILIGEIMTRIHIICSSTHLTSCPISISEYLKGLCLIREKISGIWEDATAFSMVPDQPVAIMETTPPPQEVYA